MNERLKKYLRSLGLSKDATDEQAWEFMQGLRGLQANIANALNYNDADTQARTNCDLMIRSLGYDPDDPSKLLVIEEPKRELPGDDGSSVDGDLEAAREAARREGVQAEQARRTAIEELAEIASTPQEVVRQLVADPAITVDTARQRILEDQRQRTRANIQGDRPQAPAAHINGGVTREILAAGMMHGRSLNPLTQWAENRGGTPMLRPESDETRRATDRGYEFRALPLADIIRECAAIDGIRGMPRGASGLLEHYFEGLVAQSRAFSTSALSYVFGTSINAELLAGFMDAPDTTTGGWIREADIANFKTQERTRLLKGGALELLPRGGTASHADYEDAQETYKIARYAKQFVIDEQDVVDDQFGGLSGYVPREMGDAAAQLRPDLVYSVIMANAAMRDSIALFYATTHVNLNTSSALAMATLSAARKNMRLQTENDRNLNIAAKFLIVPPTLEDTAWQLVNSPILIDGTATGTQGNRNPNASAGLVVVSEARLENGLTDPTDPTGATVYSGSSTTWYMASTANNHTIEVGYLRGNGRRPAIRPFTLDNGQWGVGWDVEFDLGAKALDWRGLCKNTA